MTSPMSTYEAIVRTPISLNLGPPADACLVQESISRLQRPFWFFRWSGGRSRRGGLDNVFGKPHEAGEGQERSGQKQQHEDRNHDKPSPPRPAYAVASMPDRLRPAPHRSIWRPVADQSFTRSVQVALIQVNGSQSGQRASVYPSRARAETASISNAS